MKSIAHERPTAGVNHLDGLLPLFRELNGLKRVRVAGKNGSWAERFFIRAWARLIAGEDVRQVALEEVAAAVVATSLAGIDAEVLAAGGLPAGARLEILQRAFDAACKPLGAASADPLRVTLVNEPIQKALAAVPPFVSLLAAQPRAGATRPGHPRVMLEPAENHAEHCAIVAVNGVLAAGVFGADPVEPFLTGLAHHLHNAYLPDAGDAGDSLLGEHQRSLIDTFRAQALQELPAFLPRTYPPLPDGGLPRPTLPRHAPSRPPIPWTAFWKWSGTHEAQAFTLDVALGEMDIIHPGPVQAFQLEVMRALGLKSTSTNASPCN